MSAHVSVFDVKRFTEARLGADELPSFEQHLAACASCAAKLQQAATRELHARGLGPLLAPAAPRPVAAVAIAVAASVLFALSLGQGPVHFSSPHRSEGPVAENGPALLITAPGSADGGTGSLAFNDGGARR